MNKSDPEQERAKALADLKTKVREMMESDIEWAMAHIDKMVDDRQHNSACTVVDDRMDNLQNMRTPKNVLCALYRELMSPRGYGPSPDSLSNIRRINYYYRYV